MTPRVSPKLIPIHSSGDSTEAIIEMRGIVKRFFNAAGEFTVLRGIKHKVT